MNFIFEMQKLLMVFKQKIEKAMTNKVEYDNAKLSVFDAMCDIEQLLGGDSLDDKYGVRA